MKNQLLFAGMFVASSIWLVAAPLSEVTFTEIVHEVNLVSATTKAATPAKLQGLLKTPDLIRSGPESRAELTAPDQTITRVGANTVFAFDAGGRSIDLQQGSLLFHSPRGKGGGTIKSGGASAAVSGTTIIVAATPGGGFKVIVLEGRGRVTLPNGKRISLREGQLVFVLAGHGASEVLDLNLGKLVDGSLLVNGFANALPSLPQIKNAIKKQGELLAKGRAEDTGILADRFTRQRPLGTLDNDAYAMLTIPLVVKQNAPGNNQGQPLGGAVQGGLTIGASGSLSLGSSMDFMNAVYYLPPIPEPPVLP